MVHTIRIAQDYVENIDTKGAWSTATSMHQKHRKECVKNNDGQKPILLQSRQVYIDNNDDIYFTKSVLGLGEKVNESIT